MRENSKLDALKINRIRCVLAFIICVLLSILVYLTMCDRLLSEPNELVEEVGWKSYHMFTILSNLLMGTAAAMCIPFTVDGMRYQNYHLPRWYVVLMYTGTFCVALTFLIALTVLSPAAGFYRMMIHSDNLIFHTVCPLMAIALFLFINSDHTLGFRSSS